MVPQFKNVFSRGSNGLKFNFPSGVHGSSAFSCPAFSGKEHKKLDARLVKDVTIFDGTELSPKTKITKIWRVSNSGAIAWPSGIQLVHIGGDNLSPEDVVNVEVLCRLNLKLLLGFARKVWITAVEYQDGFFIIGFRGRIFVI